MRSIFNVTHPLQYLKYPFTPFGGYKLKGSLNPSIFNNNFYYMYTPSYKYKHVRHFSTKQLTHVDASGNALMVNINAKKITQRTASARALVKVGFELTTMIKENGLKKGDVLSVAQLAGILGAKKTSDLIPLCHNINLTYVQVTAHLDELLKCVVVNSTVSCEGKTGVEMEALTAVSIAALTVYDMCKAISHDISITDIVLTRKTGGTSGDYKRTEVNIRDYDKSPIQNDRVTLGVL